MSAEARQQFGRFELKRRLGEGGMAEVFLAEAPIPDGGAQTCVIKVMRAYLSNQPEFVDMFLTEADICTFLSHPNLIEVYEAGEVDGRYYMAMEYADGVELAALLELLSARRIQLPIELCVYVAMCLARALDYLHRATTLNGRALELVHRDVNPTNIFLLRDGRVKLADLGVASVAFLEEGREGGPSEAPIKGKLRYLAPELLLRKPVTPRLDLYCLGVTLFEMLTGERAFVQPSDEMTMLAIVEKGLPNPRKFRRDCPRALALVVKKLSHRDPAKRYQDARALYVDLKRFFDKSGFTDDGGKLSVFVEYLDELKRIEPEPEDTRAVKLARAWWPYAVAVVVALGAAMAAAWVLG